MEAENSDNVRFRVVITIPFTDGLFSKTDVIGEYMDVGDFETFEEAKAWIGENLTSAVPYDTINNFPFSNIEVVKYKMIMK